MFYGRSSNVFETRFLSAMYPEGVIHRMHVLIAQSAFLEDLKLFFHGDESDVILCYFHLLGHLAKRTSPFLRKKKTFSRMCIVTQRRCDLATKLEFYQKRQCGVGTLMIVLMISIVQLSFEVPKSHRKYLTTKHMDQTRYSCKRLTHVSINTSAQKLNVNTPNAID